MNRNMTILLFLSATITLGACRIESGSSNGNIPKENQEISQENEVMSDEEKTSALATMEIYNQLHKGMSYEEVKEIIGSEGKAATEEGDVDGVFIWDGNNPNSFMSVSFQRNKLIRKTQMGLN
ncbi:hypothetical protein FZC84_10775 [Rossellomorea vietnamensis]|uniref:DUF3862 domain-containing protein n=1 Tax=Rossellomorea vietnamensis TaxID=218284 RepID=A0A5D4MDX9_9BACI|nr:MULTISPECIES: hypothetical protein [Bacillaceae]TYR99235.1 hypothetical protein FZC84_10775 [Rossellomorea vietnamensis]